MATTKKTTDNQPFDATLATFTKEAEKTGGDIKPYRLDLGGGKRVTFKSPDEIGTQEFVTVFSGGLDSMSEEQAVAYFLDATLSAEDKETFLAANPQLRVTVLIMQAVQEHYEAQVPDVGESPASSD